MSLEEQEKFYKNFGGFHVFVFRYRLKNENAELAEGLLKFLTYTCLLYSLVRICFYSEKESHYSYPLFQKNKKVK